MSEIWTVIDGDEFGFWLLGVLSVGLFVNWALGYFSREPQLPMRTTAWPLAQPPTRTLYSRSRLDTEALDLALAGLKREIGKWEEASRPRVAEEMPQFARRVRGNGASDSTEEPLV